MPTQKPIILARYPGIDAARQFQLNFGWGIRPERHTIETTVNHLPNQRIGNLTLTDAINGRSLTLHYCKLDDVSPRGDGVVEVTLLDRRWLWADGMIDGDYNYFDPRLQRYVRNRTARELAQFCLDAMKETGVDLSALPNDVRPRKSWNAANPAAELEQLALEFGCVVMLDPITDRTKICKIGEGESLPAGPAILRVPGLSLQQLPSEIRIVGGTSLFQSKFTIGRALGEEIDGRLIPIDDLSYKPEGGWQSHSPFTFTSIPGHSIINGERVYHWEVAARSVWRTFEFGQPSTGWAPQPLAGTPYAPTSIDDIGPFMETQLDKDPLTGEYKPIRIRGRVYRESQGKNNSAADAPWDGDVTIMDRGVFRTSKPLYTQGNVAQDFGPTQPVGTITVGHACRKHGVPIRFDWFQGIPTAPPVALPKLEYHSEIVRKYISAASAGGGIGGAAKDNLAEIQPQMQAYLNAIAATLVDQQSETVQFKGMRIDHGLDGACRRLVWSGGVKLAPSTTMATNNEPNPFVTRWEDRPAQLSKRIAEITQRRGRFDELIEQRRRGIL